MDKSDTKGMTAEELIRELVLEPLPVEGGFYRVTGSTGDYSSIYYLITPESWSAIHRLSADEIWHFYCGDPASQLQIDSEGRSSEYTLGCDLAAGQNPQLCCPAGVWQSTKLVPGGCWALFGTTMSPPYSQDEYEHGDSVDLLKDYPDLRKMIEKYTEV